MALTTTGDILLNNLPYLIRKGTYQLFESKKSYPRTGGASAPEFNHGDSWTYQGQSDWIGTGQKDWLADGPFFDGWGLDLSAAGQINVAKQLAQTQADAVNVGWIPLTIDTTRFCMIGKTDGKTYYTTDLTTWSVKNLADAGYLPAGITPYTVGQLKGVYYVSVSNGKLYSTTDGLTYTDKSTGGPTTPAYILGAYKGKLYVGYANALYTYDGTTWTQLFTGFIDGTPTLGAVGNNVIYMVTSGPRAKVYMTDSNQLYHAGTIDNDFLPRACAYVETLHIVGSQTDDALTKGQWYRLQKTGLTPIFTYGDGTVDSGIRSAYLNDNRMYWGANRASGLGVYDPTMDLFADSQMGFYVSSVISSVAGTVHGIGQFNKVMVCGIEGYGIYKQTTPGTFSVTGSNYDGNTKNINKVWGFSEIHHSTLQAGQTVTVATSKDAGSNFTTWGTSNTVGDASKLIAAPNNYKTAYNMYKMTGDANGVDLSIFDIAFAFFEAADNPKKEWAFTLILEGGTGGEYQVMRDQTLNTRSATTMITELNNLWNTKTSFDDLDGTSYTVLFRPPVGRVDDQIKDVQSGAITDMVIFYNVRLSEISGGTAVSAVAYGQATYA